MVNQGEPVVLEFIQALKGLFGHFANAVELSLLAAYGAAANYIYSMLKHEGRKFSFWKFVALLFLATFIGNFFGGMVPQDTLFRDELLMGFGFCTFPILDAMETRFKSIAVRYLQKGE